MRKISVFLVVIILIPQAIPAQNLSLATTPESIGFSSGRLRGIDTRMAGWVNRRWMNRAVGLVIRSGKIAYYNSFGYKDADAKTAMLKDDIFR